MQELYKSVFTPEDYELHGAFDSLEKSSFFVGDV